MKLQESIEPCVILCGVTSDQSWSLTPYSNQFRDPWGWRSRHEATFDFVEEARSALAASPALRASFLDEVELSEHFRCVVEADIAELLENARPSVVALESERADAIARLKSIRAPISSPFNGECFVRRGTRLTIWLWGPISNIDAPGLVCSRRVVDAIQGNSDAAVIIVRVASCGGNLKAEQMIRLALQQHKARTVAVIDRMAFSAAALIALTCDKVIARQDASIMLHGSWGYFSGNKAHLRDISRNLSIMDAAALRDIQRARRVRFALLEGLEKEGRYISADDALDLGLIGRVIPALGY